MSAFTESDVESAALAWLKAIGWRTAHGPDIAPDMPTAERSDCGREVLAALRDALLPKLIRGEIRVKDAERFLKERGL